MNTGKQANTHTHTHVHTCSPPTAKKRNRFSSPFVYQTPLRITLELWACLLIQLFWFWVGRTQSGPVDRTITVALLALHLGDRSMGGKPFDLQYVEQ